MGGRQGLHKARSQTDSEQRHVDTQHDADTDDPPTANVGLIHAARHEPRPASRHAARAGCGAGADRGRHTVARGKSGQQALRWRQHQAQRRRDLELRRARHRRSGRRDGEQQGDGNLEARHADGDCGDRCRRDSRRVLRRAHGTHEARRSRHRPRDGNGSLRQARRRRGRHADGRAEADRGGVIRPARIRERQAVVFGRELAAAGATCRTRQRRPSPSGSRTISKSASISRGAGKATTCTSSARACRAACMSGRRTSDWT
jgi:hypothetical protein